MISVRQIGNVGTTTQRFHLTAVENEKQQHVACVLKTYTLLSKNKKKILCTAQQCFYDESMSTADFRRKSLVSNFAEIQPVGERLLQAVGQSHKC